MSGKWYVIRAGHGELTANGWVNLSDKNEILESSAPFTVHEQAIEKLAKGETPRQVEQAIRQLEGLSNNFDIDIWEEQP